MLFQSNFFRFNLLFGALKPLFRIFYLCSPKRELGSAENVDQRFNAGHFNEVNLRVMAERKYTEAVLPNGIRLIHKEKQSEIAHLVLMVETGTRDELPHENGLAHFVEHTIFKGTQNRKAYHILSCLDNVGGDLNAFTTNEETCIQATFLKQHYKRTLDLFADIAFC